MSNRILYLILAAVVLAGIFRLLGLYFVGERSPLGVVGFLIVGLVSGWLAGQFMRGRGFGPLGDIVVGVIGALLGGLLFGVLVPGSSFNLAGAIVVAFVGACLFIALVRLLPGPAPI